MVSSLSLRCRAAGVEALEASSFVVGSAHCWVSALQGKFHIKDIVEYVEYENGLYDFDAYVDSKPCAPGDGAGLHSVSSLSRKKLLFSVPLTGG